MATFFDLYAAGKVSAEQVDDYIDDWHGAGKLHLHEFLGLTWEEYKLFAVDGTVLPQILKGRTNGNKRQTY